jgi:hypothetical protein
MTTEPKITTGDDDLNWVHEHIKDFGEYSDQWVAVLGCKILASGATAGDVHDQLAERGIAGALLVQIPRDVNRQVYLIA